MLHKFRISTVFGLGSWKKTCVVFAIKKPYLLILDFVSTWILNILHYLDCGRTWTEFQKFRTGSGSENT